MKRIFLSISLIICFAVCISSTCFAKDSYTQISQDEAREMMEKDDGHIVIDVRRQDEYDEGHIPGAICVPNESIGCDSQEALPDYAKRIYSSEEVKKNVISCLAVLLRTARQGKGEK